MHTSSLKSVALINSKENQIASNDIRFVLLEIKKSSYMHTTGCLSEDKRKNWPFLIN